MKLLCLMISGQESWSSQLSLCFYYIEWDKSYMAWEYIGQICWTVNLCQWTPYFFLNSEPLKRSKQADVQRRSSPLCGSSHVVPNWRWKGEGQDSSVPTCITANEIIILQCSLVWSNCKRKLLGSVSLGELLLWCFHSFTQGEAQHEGWDYETLHVLEVPSLGFAQGGASLCFLSLWILSQIGKILGVASASCPSAAMLSLSCTEHLQNQHCFLHSLSA